ncbi:DUF6879 family protein [Micromonospora sp. NBC_00860]
MLPLSQWSSYRDDHRKAGGEPNRVRVVEEPLTPYSGGRCARCAPRRG